MARSEWKVLFDANGNHKTNLNSYWVAKSTRTETRDFKFAATLSFMCFEHHARGKHVARLRDVSTNTTYEARLNDFEMFVPRFRDGAISGTFGFHKIGASVGLVLVLEEEETA